MGTPMAERLLQAGHTMAVHNRAPGKADGLVAAGTRFAPTPADAAAGAEIIVSMMPRRRRRPSAIMALRG